MALTIVGFVYSLPGEAAWVVLANHFLTLFAIWATAILSLKRKEAGEMLRQSEQQYRFVVEDQTELVCRFAPDTTLTFVNEAYCNYFGKSREELLRHSFLELVPEQVREATRNHIAALVENPRIVTLRT